MAKPAKKQDLTSDFHSEIECGVRLKTAFGLLPDEWGRDPRISPEELCLLAYRCTFADDRSKFGLWQSTLSKTRILKDFGRDVRERATAAAVAGGRLFRPHNSTQPRRAGYKFAKAVDRLNLPESEPSNSRVIYRRWFDGSFSRNAMAAFIYIQVGTGKGPELFARELKERFGWSENTTHKVLKELLARGIVERQQRRNKGRMAGVIYAISSGMGEQLPEAASEQDLAAPQKPGHGLSGRGVPGDGLPGHKCIYPLNVSIQRSSTSSYSPEKNILSDWTRAAADGADRVASTNSELNFSDATQVHPLRPEQRVLKRWQASPYFRKHEFRHTGDAKPPFDLVTWRFWLDRYGGAPAHVQTVAAHRQASEIAHELAAVSEETRGALHPAALPTLVEWSEKHPEAPRLQPTSINKLLGGVQAVTVWAHDNGFTSDDKPWADPFARMRLEEPEPDREPWEIEELKLLFGSRVFTEGYRPEAGCGEAAYWLPLLALFTGARQGELAPLTVDDVQTDEETGIVYFRITEDTELGARIKTEKSSRRVVPVHPELVRLGFLDIVTGRRREGPRAQIFPLMEKGPRGSFSEDWSKWFGRYRKRIGIPDNGPVFHSFRHNFKDALRQSGESEDINDALTGHWGGGVGRGYGAKAAARRFGMKRLADAVTKVAYPGLSLVHLYPSQPSAAPESQCGDGAPC